MTQITSAEVHVGMLEARPQQTELDSGFQMMGDFCFFFNCKHGISTREISKAILCKVKSQNNVTLFLEETSNHFVSSTSQQKKKTWHRSCPIPNRYSYITNMKMNQQSQEYTIIDDSNYFPGQNDFWATECLLRRYTSPVHKTCMSDEFYLFLFCCCCFCYLNFFFHLQMTMIITKHITEIHRYVVS